MNVLTSHIYDMWKCECEYFDQIKIQSFFTLAQKMFYSHWCKGMWTTLSLCANENGKCNEFGHVSVNDLRIHDYTWPFTCYL